MYFIVMAIITIFLFFIFALAMTWEWELTAPIVFVCLFFTIIFGWIVYPTTNANTAQVIKINKENIKYVKMNDKVYIDIKLSDVSTLNFIRTDAHTFNNIDSISVMYVYQNINFYGYNTGEPYLIIPQ